MKSFYCILASVLVASAFAEDSNPVEAFDNATIQPAGPRSGGNGKAFFNIEGKANNAFASYGVADFDGSMFSFSGSPTSISAIKLEFVQANAGFTNSGNLRFFLSGDTATSIQPGVSPLIFDAATTYGIAAGNLVPLNDIGGAVFTEVASGQLDTYTLNVSGAAATLLLDAYNNDTPIRLVISQDAGDDAVAATWAGFSHSTAAGPTLTLMSPSGISPTSYEVTLGTEIGGSLASLVASDDDSLSILNDDASLTGEIRFDATSGNLNPSSYTFKFEGLATRPGLTQQLLARNFDTNGLVQIDGRLAPTTDTPIEVTLTTNPGAFVGGAGQLETRVRWSPINDEDPSQDGWALTVDYVSWDIQ